MIVAQKRPGLARLVVTALACLIGVAGSAVAYSIAKAIGQATLATGVAAMLPVTTAWVAVALTQHLMGRAST